MRRFYAEVMSTGNLAAVHERVAADLTNMKGFLVYTDRRAELVKCFIATFRTAFPDLHANVEDIMAVGAKVVARVTPGVVLTTWHDAKAWCGSCSRTGYGVTPTLTRYSRASCRLEV